MPRQRVSAFEQRVLERAERGLAGELNRIPSLRLPQLLDKLADLTEAKRSVVLSNAGSHTETVEVDDVDLQFRAVREALVLHNAYPAKQFEISGHVRVEELHEWALRFAEMSPERLAEMLEASEREPLALPETAEGAA